MNKLILNPYYTQNKPTPVLNFICDKIQTKMILGYYFRKKIFVYITSYANVKFLKA